MSNKDYEEARKKVAEASQQVTALLKSIGLDEQGDQFEALQKSLDDQDPPHFALILITRHIVLSTTLDAWILIVIHLRILIIKGGS